MRRDGGDDDEEDEGKERKGGFTGEKVASGGAVSVEENPSGDAAMAIDSSTDDDIDSRRAKKLKSSANLG
jgi:hypothetical protein